MFSSLFLSLALVLTASVGFANSEHHEGREKPILFPPKQADASLATRPAKVVTLEPAYLATMKPGSVTLKWKESEGAEVYHVQVAKDSNFKWLVTENFDVKGTTFEVGGLEAGNNYWWRVAGRRPNNDALYTKGYFGVSSFKVR